MGYRNKSAIYNRFHSAFLVGLSRRKLKPYAKRKPRACEPWKPLPLQIKMRGNPVQRLKLAWRVQAKNMMARRVWQDMQRKAWSR